MIKAVKFLVCLTALCLLFGCGKTSDNTEPSAVEVPSGTDMPTPPPSDEVVIEKVEEPAPITPTGEVNDMIEEKPADTALFDGKVIVIDAGHGRSSSKKQEEIAPTSTKTKPAFVSGTSGKSLTEEELNLAVALKLQAALESMGAAVHMTRTTHEATLSNIGRAEFANSLNADISVKLHADGSDSASVHGISVLVPGGEYIRDNDMLYESRAAGEYILSALVSATGASDRGISVRNDMTGFNWSTVPVVLVEMGFMTNAQEDALLSTSEYQDKIVSGIVSGLELYFSEWGISA